MLTLLRLTDPKSFDGVQALKNVSFELRGRSPCAGRREWRWQIHADQNHYRRHQPDAGTLELDGRRDPHQRPSRRRTLGIAAIYQQPALFPDLSVAENIALGLETGGPWRRVHWRRGGRGRYNCWRGSAANIDPDARGPPTCRCRSSSWSRSRGRWARMREC